VQGPFPAGFVGRAPDRQAAQTHDLKLAFC
jgi:hypothetical protein